MYIPEELKRNFAVGLLDKSIGDTVTGIGQTAGAFFDNPFSTLGSVAYAMTVGKVVDVGRGIGFAWDAAWGTGTARSDIEQFVEDQKKQIDESGAGYYGGAMTGQALAYVLFGKAFRSMDDKHTDLGGSGGGKKESDKDKEGTGQSGKPFVDKEQWLGSLQNTKMGVPMVFIMKGRQIATVKLSGRLIHLMSLVSIKQMLKLMEYQKDLNQHFFQRNGHHNR